MIDWSSASFSATNGKAHFRLRLATLKLGEEDFIKTQSVFSELYDLPMKIVDKRGAERRRDSSQRPEGKKRMSGIWGQDHRLSSVHPAAGRIALRTLGPSWWAASSGKSGTWPGSLTCPSSSFLSSTGEWRAGENKRPMLSGPTGQRQNRGVRDVVMFSYRMTTTTPNRRPRKEPWGKWKSSSPNSAASQRAKRSSADP